ncbi:MAG: glycosyl hydrolase, partial [Desulfobacterales bacterium]
MGKIIISKSWAAFLLLVLAVGCSPVDRWRVFEKETPVMETPPAEVQQAEDRYAPEMESPPGFKLPEGGGPVEVNLPQPYTLREFYRDVKVLAYPAFDAVELPFDPAEIKISSPGWIDHAEALFDGELHSSANFGFKTGQPQHLDFVLPRETELAGIRLHHGSRESVVGPMKCRLWQSQDGENYEPVAEIEMDQSEGSAGFPAFRARYLRLEMLEWSRGSGDGEWAFLAAVEFLPPGGRSAFSDIPEFMLKAAFWHRRTPLGDTRADDAVPVVEQSQVLDLTARMDAEGTLRWEAPVGRWRVVRFGYTTTGHQNGPATDEGRGLECDKLDAEAVEKFFNGYAGKMLDANAKHCGITITRLFHDSFEALAQNWTPALAEEFHQRRGYELWPWLPVMAGEHVESVEATERFLYDLRRTLSEMMADVYYATLNRLAESRGVRLLVQSAGEQQMMINPIAYSRQVGIPSTEFWIGKTSDSSVPYDGRPLEFCTNGSVYDAISVTKHRGISVIPGESFTTKLTDYSITPRVLKRVGSKAFAVGFNQFEMHTYIHQPEEDY